LRAQERWDASTRYRAVDPAEELEARAVEEKANREKAEAAVRWRARRSDAAGHQVSGLTERT
jgi:hypothetical protein